MYRGVITGNTLFFIYTGKNVHDPIIIESFSLQINSKKYSSVLTEIK